MKVLAITLALAGIAATAPLNAQVVMCTPANGWSQVGQGRDNNSIYVRRTHTNGNLVIQRAHRNADGTCTIFSTRTARDSDKAWKKTHKAEHREMKRTLSKEQYKAWEKADKQEHKADKQAVKAAEQTAKAAHGKGKGKN